jgi:hypothetical protein
MTFPDTPRPPADPESNPLLLVVIMLSLLLVGTVAWATISQSYVFYYMGRCEAAGVTK